MFLYKVFEHWLNSNGQVWLYSDPHFNDEEMKYIRKDYIGDDEQIKRINSKVGKHDTIIFLGDMGDLSFISQIKGYKVLIMGNHDTKSPEYYLAAGFQEVYDGPLMINDRVILSHEPMTVPPYIFNIHGHDHSAWYQVNPEQHLNVCAEWINYTPVPLMSFMKKGGLAKIPHMHRFFIDKRNDEIAEKEKENE